jgi:hypothetical protein
MKKTIKLIIKIGIEKDLIEFVKIFALKGTK